MNVEGTFLTDQNSNLSRDCRQFYERRVMMAESASKDWHAIETEITFGTVRRNKAGTIVRSRTQDEDNEPFVRLPLKIAQLRRELLSLVNLDNELFKNLLTLHDTIEELREQQTRHKIKKEIAKPVLKPVLKPISKPCVAEEELEHLEWPLSFEEAQMFASLPVVPNCYNNNYTKTLPNATRRKRLESQSQDETSGAMKFVLRSKSFLMRQPFQRKHISFPATKQNRMKEENVQNQQTLTRKTSGPHDLRAPFSSLNICGSTSHVATRPAPTNQQIVHLPPSRFLWQKMFFSSLGTNTNGPESLPCRWMASDDGGFGDKSPLSLNHIKQSSFDSGIHGSDSEFSVKI